MKNIRVPLFALLVSLFFMMLAANAFAQFGPADDAEPRSHNFDVQHIELHLSFDEPKGKVIGEVTHIIVPLRESIDTIAFDEYAMDFSKVTVNQVKDGAIQNKDYREHYDTSGNQIHIRLSQSFTPHDTLAVTLDYTCTPHKGLYFIAPDSADPAKPHQIWSQGEGEDNHYWFPCYDYPNDKATSEMYATVPAHYSVLSNGELAGKTDGGNGLVTWHWVESHPHSSYLITLAVGDYDIVRSSWMGKPVEYWAWKGRMNDLDSCFKYTPDMMSYFSKIIGFPYAWEKYAQVIVADFIYGGMENTSATTLVDMALHDKRAELDYNAMGLIAHELAHQWWGDVTTCRGWKHIWLNEGFATYFQMLYFEHLYGEDRFRYDLWGTQRGSISAEKYLGKKPIVTAGGLTANTYGKAATVLNMIRHVLGDTDFFRSLNHYINVHKFNNVETEDLEIAIQEATGQNLHPLFEEWLYKAGHPVYDVSYTWDADKKMVTLIVAQTQKKDSLTGYFDMPIDIEIDMHDGSIVKTIHDADSVDTFAIACPDKPEYVIFDKGSNITKELNFNRPLSDILSQLLHGDPVERGYAVVDLKKFDTSDIALRALESTALNDSYEQVQQEAIGVLGEIKNNETVQNVLIQLTRNKHPQIRTAAVNALSDHPTEQAYAAAEHILNTDESYAAKRAAIYAMTEMDSTLHKGTFEKIAPYTDSSSFRDWLRLAALNGMNILKDPRAVPYALKYAHDGYVRDARVEAIYTLQKLAKGNKDAIDLMMQCLTDKSHAVRNAAASSLAVIGDESLIPRLKTAMANENYSWIKDTLQATITKLEAHSADGSASQSK
ncbi:MAG TPA: M1 family aminopeptidase [Candidatus Kapabacteria bacterium]|nr:M1 family aminopeptidase [Candidatus Kapabacteria bacterium]